jgi:hypothetical protein
MPTTTAPRTRSRTSTPPLPPGARIPQPMLLQWVVRAVLAVAFAVYVLSPTVLSWASEHAASAAARGGQLDQLLLPPGMVPEGDASDPTADPIAPALASTVIAILTPAVVRALGAVSAIGGALIALELLATATLVGYQRRELPHVPTTSLLIRAPRPAGTPPGRTGGGAAPSGDQFFRAIQQALPRGSLVERLSGTSPWAAFTLSGTPDQPIALGITVADRSAARRGETAAAIRAVIQGQLPGAQVEAAPDSLHLALEAGVRVAWREYGLTLPPHYPLRFLDDITGSDLLGPLVAALAPRGVRCTEAQLIVRPVASRALNASWRGRAMALLLTLQAKGDYALAEDTKAIEAKLDAAPFAVTLRIVATADGADAEARLDAALNQVAEVLGQYHQRTSHHLQTLAQVGAGSTVIDAARHTLHLASRASRPTPLPELLLPVRPWRDPEMLTSVELAGLWHLPTAGLGSLVRWLPCAVLPAPPHAYIPEGRTDRITVGRARRADGTVAPVGPTLRDLRPPLHITAGMGAGKSRALANICQQCVPHGYLLLDGKGDDQGGSLATTVRSSIPLADERRLVIFDVLDTDWPIGLNPLAGIDLTRPGAKDQALGQIMAIFARLDPSTWGKAPAMKEFVQMATLLVLEGEAAPTLAHVKQCLLDASYRAQLLPHCTNPDVQTFWTLTFPDQGEQQRTSLHALLRRFSQLLTTETTRYLVSQPSSRLNLLKAIEERLIVLVPLPHVTLGDLASAVGMLLLQQFVRSAFARDGTDQTRHTYPLIIDELQVFISADGDSADLQSAITQLRGLGIAGIYAHQTLDQLGQLRDEMLTNSGSRLILRTQEPDASTYARLYAASGITAMDIAGQDASEHQYAVLQCDGERTGLFSMAVLPWPEPLAVPVEPYDGPDWQTLVPPDSPDPDADAELLRIVYGAHEHPASVAAALSQASDDEWRQVLARWEAIRAFHRQYLIDHPGCVAVDETITDPDPAVQAARRCEQQRRDRQRWLSRLLVATPRVLAAAEYVRIRRQIEPGTDSAPPRGRGRGRQEAPTLQVTGGEVITAGVPQPQAEALVPIGFVSGATPPPGVAVPVPRIPDSQTHAQVMETRGRRRAKDDIAPGFEDLTRPDDVEEERVEP